MSDAIQIDGSYGEGGGQIIRTSVSLAALTGRAVEIHNVRAKRSRPGLQRQHLTAVLAAAELCDAQVNGAAPNSVYFRFAPRKAVRPGEYRFEIGTAGASTLVAQTVLIPLALAAGESSVKIVGGTHVPHSPPADYLEAVYLPMLRQARLDARFQYPKAGFFPRGGGQLWLEVGPSTPLLPIDFTERGKLQQLTAYVITSGLPEHVADRGEATVRQFMKGIGRSVEVVRRDLPSPGQGAAVVLTAACERGAAGFTAIGERGLPMEKVAHAPCEAFLAWWKSGAACDEHLADQLVLPAALAHGDSRWTTPTVTEHLRTVLWLTEHFLPIQHSFEELPGGAVELRLTGSGLQH